MPAILLNLLKSYGGYALIIAAAGGWFLYHDHQEIDKGEARVEAAQKAADLKEAAHVAKVVNDATITITGLQARLADALATPAPAPTVAVWMRVIPAAGSPDEADSTPSPSPSGNGSAGPGSSVGSSGQEVDIAPVTESILKDDRAIIQYLQGYIQACQTAGVCAR